MHNCSLAFLLKCPRSTFLTKKKYVAMQPTQHRPAQRRKCRLCTFPPQGPHVGGSPAGVQARRCGWGGVVGFRKTIQNAFSSSLSKGAKIASHALTTLFTILDGPPPKKNTGLQIHRQDYIQMLRRDYIQSSTHCLDLDPESLHRSRPGIMAYI